MMDGVCSNSDSVKSHCDSAIIRTSLGRADGWVAAGIMEQDERTREAERVFVRNDAVSR